MQLFISTLASIASGLMVGILILIVKRSNTRAEERQKQITEQWAVEKQVNDCTTDLAYRTGKAVHNAGLCNGEVEDKIKDLEEAKKERSEFYRKVNATIAVKNG